MSPEERAAAELLVNQAVQRGLTNILVALTILATLWLIWQRLGSPTIDLKPWLAPIVSSVSAMVGSKINNVQLALNSTERTEPTNERTNEPTRTPRTALHLAADRLIVDRTRPAIIAVLVAAGWKTTDIRGMLKGTAEDIGQEVKAAQESEPPPRTLVVDGKRTIAL